MTFNLKAIGNIIGRALKVAAIGYALLLGAKLVQIQSNSLALTLAYDRAMLQVMQSQGETADVNPPQRTEQL
jgi:hypothetical protein